ncbi:MAG: hypothetical protein NTW08_04740 [Gammaproteobacteria bacterium]|nr:hypothetical protein [Gammaproteobacteria bacterium]
MPNNDYILLSGNIRAGKTEVRRRLCERPTFASPFSSQYEATQTLEYQCFSTGHMGKLAIWDMPGTQTLPVSLLVNTKIVLHCVDLSSPFDSADLETKIKAIQATHPNILIRLVGTHSDSTNAALVFGQLNRMSILLGLPFSPMRTSAKTGEGFLALRTFCLTSSDELSPYEQEKKNFLKAIQALPLRIKRELKEEIEKFEKAKNKQAYLGEFKTNCVDILKDSHPAMRALLTLVVVISLTLLLGAMGFGIGLAVGSWALPGAFITGLAVGSLESTAVIASAVTFGIFAGGYGAHRMMKTPPQEMLYDITGRLMDFN